MTLATEVTPGQTTYTEHGRSDGCPWYQSLSIVPHCSLDTGDTRHRTPSTQGHTSAPAAPACSHCNYHGRTLHSDRRYKILHGWGVQDYFFHKIYQFIQNSFWTVDADDKVHWSSEYDCCHVRATRVVERKYKVGDNRSEQILLCYHVWSPAPDHQCLLVSVLSLVLIIGMYELLLWTNTVHRRILFIIVEQLPGAHHMLPQHD